MPKGVGYPGKKLPKRKKDSPGVHAGAAGLNPAGTKLVRRVKVKRKKA